MLSYEFDTNQGPLTVIAATDSEANIIARSMVAEIYGYYCAGEASDS